MKTYVVEIKIDDRNSENALLAYLESFGKSLNSHYPHPWSVICSDQNGNLIQELGYDLEELERGEVQ